MTDERDTVKKRRALVELFVGRKVPRLWCPPLTHYLPDGCLDMARIKAHWTFMSPHVRSFLLPGTTGDGWELTDGEAFSLIDQGIELSQSLHALLLIGVLKPDAPSMHEAVTNIIERLKKKAGLEDPLEALKQCRICGFAVCPPRGRELSQEEIENALDSILMLGLPTAFYQLPQVTENEISPLVVSALAERHENLLMFKDSSGSDRVALEDKGRSGIFLMRGAEGDYARWLAELGGPYHGLLLSTGNCFPSQLKQIVTQLENGQNERALELSNRITGVFEAALKTVSPLAQGNPFTNANKALDHFMAYGRDAGSRTPPPLHAGIYLPDNIIRACGENLEQAGLMPEKGYLE